MTPDLPDGVTAVLLHGPVLVGGLAFGLVAGLIPGISGRIGLLIALPVALWFDPVGAAVFLIAMHAVVHTTGSVPAVLLGLPTSSSEAATVMDGWPMMQQGRGGQAVGAILAASLAGGVLGALALLLLAPLGMILARQFTSAEVAALSATGLLAIAALSGRSIALGLAVAALGVLAATVGVDTLPPRNALRSGGSSFGTVSTSAPSSPDSSSSPGCCATSVTPMPAERSRPRCAMPT